ncbi:hypothetical protein [Leifsonia shinshuensis]|nr:hypothetical protein [Leifsonia shinshuensis]
MTAIVEEDRTRVHPAEGAHTGAPLGLGGAFPLRSDADVVILGYD